MIDRSWYFPSEEPLDFDRWAMDFTPTVVFTNLQLKVNTATKAGDFDLALQRLKHLIHYKIDNGHYGGKNISKIHRKAW